MYGVLLSAHAESASSAIDPTTLDDNFPLPSIIGDMFVPRIDEALARGVTHFPEKIPTWFSSRRKDESGSSRPGAKL
jgi:hypothetical protein